MIKYRRMRDRETEGDPEGLGRFGTGLGCGVHFSWREASLDGRDRTHANGENFGEHRAQADEGDEVVPIYGGADGHVGECHSV